MRFQGLTVKLQGWMGFRFNIDQGIFMHKVKAAFRKLTGGSKTETPTDAPREPPGIFDRPPLSSRSGSRSESPLSRSRVSLGAATHSDTNVQNSVIGLKPALQKLVDESIQQTAGGIVADLSSFRLGSQTVVALVKKHPEVVEWKLSGNELDNSAAVSLSKSNAKKIDLSSNPGIKDFSARYFAKSNAESLNLSHTGVKEEGLLEIAQKNKQLISLDLNQRPTYLEENLKKEECNFNITHAVAISESNLEHLGIKNWNIEPVAFRFLLEESKLKEISVGNARPDIVAIANEYRDTVKVIIDDQF